MRPFTAAHRYLPTAFRPRPVAHFLRVASGTHFPACPLFSDYHHHHHLSLTLDEVRTMLNDLGDPIVVDFSGGGFNYQDPRPDEGLSEQLIHESLKTTICLDVDDNKKDPQICVVCQDNLCQENQTIGILKCKHEFHESCIKEWLRQKNVCPLCKAIAIRD